MHHYHFVDCQVPQTKPEVLITREKRNMPTVIVKEIKDGRKASEIADHYRVHQKTVYRWLERSTRSHVSFKEYQKMKKERDTLLAPVGELLLKTKSSVGEMEVDSTFKETGKRSTRTLAKKTWDNPVKFVL